MPLNAWRSAGYGLLWTSTPRVPLRGTPEAAMTWGGPVSMNSTGSATWNGTSWTKSSDLPVALESQEGAGNPDAMISMKGMASGSVCNMAHTFDGTAWSQTAYTINNMHQSDHGGGLGTQNAAMSILYTEIYDGISWTAGGSHNDSSYYMGGTGTVNAALEAGHSSPAGGRECTEEYDGVSWTVKNPMNNKRQGAALGGTVFDALVFGGDENWTEHWNGTSWTNVVNQSCVGAAEGDGASSNSVIASCMGNTARGVWVYEPTYPTTASLGIVTPTKGITTDTFSLKNKYVNDDNTVLLINSDTVHGSTYFISGSGDSSLSNLSMSRGGAGVIHSSGSNEAVSASFAKFGNSAVYCSGSDNCLFVTGSDVLSLGTKKWTVEGWYYFLSDPSGSSGALGRDYHGLWGHWQDSTDYIYAGMAGTGNQYFRIQIGGANTIYWAGDGVVRAYPNQWNHIVWQRHDPAGANDNSFSFFINGKRASGTWHGAAVASETVGSYVGDFIVGQARDSSAKHNMFGYVDSFRVSTNIARYDTVDFIPPVGGEIVRVASGSAPTSPFTSKKYESTTFKLPQFTNFDQPAILTETPGLTNGSSSYSTIVGTRTGSGAAIKELNVGTIAGDMWFNRENNSLNFTWESSSYSSGVWSAGDALMIAKEWPEGAGVVNAAVIFGGHNHPTNCTTEHYDGAAWSRGGDQISSKSYFGSAGTQNAALSFGGNPSNTAEEYNGFVWTAGGTPGCDRYSNAGTGTQNAALNFGGEGVTADTEEYNGTAWSEGGNLNVARRLLTGAGEQYATLAIGGHPGLGACTEEYNGSVWAVATALPVIRDTASAGGGVGDAWLAGGNSPSLTGITLEYNGTTWNAGGTLNTNKNGGAGDGFAGSAWVAGGTNPGAITCTEEYAGSGIYKTLKVCAVTGSQA